MLIQFHHQFEDDHTDFVAQTEFKSSEDTQEYIQKLKISHPLPINARWMMCTERSKRFMKTHANRDTI